MSTGDCHLIKLDEQRNILFSGLCFLRHVCYKNIWCLFYYSENRLVLWKTSVCRSMNFLPLSFIFSSDLFSIFLISCLGPCCVNIHLWNRLNFSVSSKLIPFYLLSLSAAVSLFTFFSRRLVSASKLAQECVCPFASSPFSLHPTLHFLCPSSPKYWLAVMVALCVNCCCWQVCLINRRKSKEREARGGIKAGKYLGWTVCFELYHYLFSSCLVFLSCHNIAVFSSIFSRSGSCVSHGLRKEHGFPGWVNTFQKHTVNFLFWVILQSLTVTDTHRHVEKFAVRLNFATAHPTEQIYVAIKAKWIGYWFQFEASNTSSIKPNGFRPVGQQITSVIKKFCKN